MPALVLLQGGEATRFELKDADVVVGRHPECGVQLQSNMVSRHHCRVLRDGEEFFVEDMGSGNGTLVNGRRIEARTLLRHDDRIKLGPVLLRFEAEITARPPRKFTPAAPAAPFDLDIAAGKDDSATIMGALEGSGAFGMLDVQPQAKLKAVIEISRSLAGSTNLESHLPKILDTLFDIFPQADRGCVLLKDPLTGQMIPATQKHRRHTEDSTVRLSRTVLNKVLEQKQGILSADALNDSQFQASESISNLTIRSMMCVPMLGLDGEPMGVINVDTQNPLNQFKKDDLDLLMAVAGQAALSYEGARLLTSHMERLRLDREMAVARNVQRALLPEQLPCLPGCEFFASYESAQAVGGDYYDGFLLGDGKICLSFGDVAGKGVPASLVMSRIASVVRSTLLHVHDVAEAMTAVNNHMCAGMVEGRFVTYVLVILDTNTHEMAAAIAGHMPPVIRRADGAVEQWGEEAVGLPVGVVEDYPYEVVRRTLQPGETVLIYTDGVSEAMNPAGDLYGMETVLDFVKNGPKSAGDLGEALLADVRRHAAGRPQNDDITIMTFGRNA